MGPAAKKRKLASSRVESIEFDDAARHEFLTGFHKRKQQRIKHAQETAKEKDRLAKIEERKQLREQRDEDLAKHVQLVNSALRGADNEDEDEEAEENEINVAVVSAVSTNNGYTGHGASAHEEEYVDEERYTTVTVGPMPASDSEQSDNSEHTKGMNKQNGKEEATRDVEAGKKGSKERSRSQAKDHKPRAKRKKFRYESKSERQAARKKERSKNSAAAQARRSKG